jgi:hypothetical protein
LLITDAQRQKYSNKRQRIDVTFADQPRQIQLDVWSLSDALNELAIAPSVDT